jgi:hypothetical protein
MFLTLDRIPTVAAAAVAASIVAAPLQAAELELLKLVERAANDTVTDTGEKGDSVGDLLTFANDVYDEANAEKAGTDNGWCIRTAVGKAWECFWTLTLKGGQITVHGPFLDGRDSVLAVTGGTGDYVGVTGEMKLHARNAEGTEYDFHYTLAW